ncbi:MAG: methylated-DNA--[protein]-cysteine S-methyltransferase [Elusimicrobia bacterium]|nr:methylated-DNA--[protein]-cysteine S-methyltransferase [Elusimicrobiota bacterium]
MKSLPRDCVLDKVDSPVGNLWLIASDAGLHGALWDNDRQDYAGIFGALKSSRKHPVIAKAREQFAEYFSGRRKSFDIPLVIDGTPFEKQAWRQLSGIPYGETISYAEQARRLGSAKKARAVGLANSRNPISIIVPCHRVVGKSGALTGYGGGLDKKKFLIELERGAAKG